MSLHNNAILISQLDAEPVDVIPLSKPLKQHPYTKNARWQSDPAAAGLKPKTPATSIPIILATSSFGYRIS